jgi:hypothetical protein
MVWDVELFGTNGLNLMKNFKEIKLTKGPLAGKTILFETPGTTVTVVCPECGWQDWQTFYIRDFTERDIGRKCDECDSELIFGPEEDEV